MGATGEINVCRPMGAIGWINACMTPMRDRLDQRLYDAHARSAGSTPVGAPTRD